jgi:alpha-ketoglutarate-dependent taurine dioxygenase
MKLLISFIIPLTISAYNLIQHPIESRCAYIYNYDFKNGNKDDNLQKLFEDYPLLIFRNSLELLNPTDFTNFLNLFNDNNDSLSKITFNGNYKAEQLFNTTNISIQPNKQFINNYVWHTDLLGHPEKNQPIIVGFNVIDIPLFGGETEFISGEKIWSCLPDNIKLSCRNMVIKNNRKNFFFGNKIMDYSGTYIVKDTDELFEDNDITIPIVYEAESPTQLPRVLIQPSFFENIVGLSKEESQLWIKDFMIKYALPHKFSIQWLKGDVCVFNNRRFIRSTTPARNYLDFEKGSQKLFLQTYISTNKEMKACKPSIIDRYIHRENKICTNDDISKDISDSSIRYHLRKFIQKKLNNFN